MSTKEAGFTYNSIDWGATYGVRKVNRVDRVLPAPRLQSQRLAQVDGVASQGSSWDERILSFECEVVGLTTPASRDTQIDNIAAAWVATELGEKPLVLGWDTGKTIQARIINGFEPAIFYAGFTFTIEFLCPDPWFKADSETNESDAISGDTTVTYSPIGGNRPVPDPVWTVKNTGAALAGDLTLQGITSGDLIAYSGALGTDEWIRFTRETGAVEISTNSGGSWTPANTNISGTIPSLLGGQNNSVKIFNIVTGTLELDYFARSI